MCRQKSFKEAKTGNNQKSWKSFVETELSEEVEEVLYKKSAKKVVLLACGFYLNVQIYISTIGETNKGKTNLDRETHDFHVRHVDVRDQWDMQVQLTIQN